MNNLNDELVLSLEVPVNIINKNDYPCIELRKITNDSEIIKQIVSAAFHNKPIIILPVFTNKLKSLSSLIDKGIIYKNYEDNTFYFNI